ncbi:MAG TPA: outer membrane beta-barrel protein [Candidatus Acidoferrales bacterium]|jgi:hypothetical protein|nr:outer membrane beta-barrel protein [Candidatus Acidoferrales bacterium]
MRKWIVFCVAALCFVGTASAQSNVSVAVPVSAPAPDGAHASFNEDSKVLVGLGYTYQYFDIGGNNTSMNGIQGSVAYFVNNYFAIEGATTATFGNLNSTTAEHIVFYGGGGRLQLRGRRMQPWVHALFGGGYARFTQGIGPASFNSYGIMAGGGVDYKFSPHAAIRVQGDYLGTHFGGVWQTTASVGAGIVFDF